ncbi:hypothetical protein [Fictibacillus enclensis]|nr:hypothetical protein [Fictibacillus enclensis]
MGAGFVLGMFRFSPQKGKYNYPPFDFASKSRETKIQWLKDQIVFTEKF